MHRIFKKLILLFLMIGFLFPLETIAQASPLRCCKISRSVTLDGVTYSAGSRIGSGGAATCSISGGAYRETKNWTIICLLSSIIVITDWVFLLAIMVSGLMVILGAYTIATAAGNPQNVTKGKNYIIFAMIGFVLALLFKAIPNIVMTLIGA